MLDLSRGKTEEAAIDFEAWARLDPASGAKAGVAAQLLYYARQFEEAIRWGQTAFSAIFALNAASNFCRDFVISRSIGCDRAGHFTP